MLLVCVWIYVFVVIGEGGGNEDNQNQKDENTMKIETFFRKRGNHTNNWAVLVDTSRFWFNYRHSANALGIYRTIKRLGIPDSHIILMLADDIACNPRNIDPGVVLDQAGSSDNLYGDNIEVDYRGYEVTVENFIRVLTGRHEPNVPRSKRLLSDSSSNILIYLTGHGGDEFLKFQDYEEISSQDLADCFEQMYEKKRYNELLFIIDTCQANTLYNAFYSPNILAIGSSRREENSYAYHGDINVGVSLIDRFSYYTLEYLNHVGQDSNATLQDIFSSYDTRLVNSHPDWREDLYSRPPEEVLITEFFGYVTPVEITTQFYPLE